MENIGNIASINEDGVLGIKSESSPFLESFYFIDVYDEKLVKKYIKSVEKLIRTSKEYNHYIECLRTNFVGLNQDSIQSNINTADVSLEFHHYPLTLYDIVEVVMFSNFMNNKKITTFNLAKEIMDLHVRHYVGLVPLTKTNHELAHCGKLFISKKQIFGEYTKFLELYKAGLSATHHQKISELEKDTTDSRPSDFLGIYE